MDASPTLELETDRLLLRGIDAAEADRLQRVFERCADHFEIVTGPGGPDPDAAGKELRASAATPGREIAVLVASDSGEDIGAVGWWAGNPLPDRALLGMLMVVPERRREGVAAEALAALEVWLAGRGIVALRTAFQRRRLAIRTPVRALGFVEMSIAEHTALGLAGAGISLWEKPVGR